MTSSITTIRRAALSLLARRDYSKYELTQTLRAKGHALQDIQLVLADLSRAHYLNETRFIEHFIHQRCSKGYGPKRISAELEARGINPEMIAERLKITDNAFLSEARKVLKKHSKGKSLDDFKERAKQIRFLQYRGFSQEHINAVMFKTDSDDDSYDH